MLRGSLMAKRKANSPDTAAEPGRAKKRSVILDDDLVPKMAFIAESLGMTLPDYVNNRLRPIVQAEFKVVLKGMGEVFED